MTDTNIFSDFALRLRSFAEVIVRVGLNLQRGQRLLITEPYELQGVARSAEVIVGAVQAMVDGPVEVIWGDGARLRESAEKKDWRGFTRLVKANAEKMESHVRHGDALLFLQGSQPKLLEGIAPEHIAELRRIGWDHFGPVAQQLMAGETNWTVAPAPSPGWAEMTCADLPEEKRLATLWETVFASMRIPSCRANSGRASSQGNPLEAWQAHLAALTHRCNGLNARRLKTLRYQGAGTDLTVALPAEHRWCTAQLTTKAGLSFVANLPTEEIFTAPHKDSAEGAVRVARPISYGGAVIDGIELEFKRGRIVQAQARTGAALLRQMLETDEGAMHLGEVAIVAASPGWASVSAPMPVADGDIGNQPDSPRLFYHPLLDENVSDHIALGEAYGFCLHAPNPAALNHSLIHVDLPIDACVALPETGAS